MTQEIVTNGHAPLTNEIISSLVLNGDISQLTPQQKVQYYGEYCKRLGLDPATQPFKILKLNGKELFYADKGCAAQLVRLHGLSQQVTGQEIVENIFTVTVRTSDASGRFSDSMGAVPIQGKHGEDLSNALMKAHTKAKRRGTLEFMGLGALDEIEVSSIPNARAETISGQPVAMPALNGSSPAPSESSLNSSLFVTEVKVLKTGTNRNGEWRLYKVSFSDGTEATTFDQEKVDVAEQLLSAGVACVFDTAPSKNGRGLELLDIHADRGLASTNHSHTRSELLERIPKGERALQDVGAYPITTTTREIRTELIGNMDLEDMDDKTLEHYSQILAKKIREANTVEQGVAA